MSDLKKHIAALDRDESALRRLAGGFSEVFRESEPPPQPTASVAAVSETTPTTSYRRGHGFYPGGFPREFYLPKALRGTEPTYHNPEGTDLDFWFYEASGAPCAIAFQGKGQKPLWRTRFRNDVERQRYVDETITNRTRGLAAKGERAATRKAFRHTLAVGDVIYTSWGYDQTNVDFYQVVGVKEQSVVIRKIGGCTTEHGEGGSDRVAAAKGEFIGPPMIKRVAEGNEVKVGNHYAHPWSGAPVYQTASGWGH